MRTLPAPDLPLYTGPVRFGDGRPGIFISGDVAMSLAPALIALAKLYEDRDTRVVYLCNTLNRLLSSCFVRESCPGPDPSSPNATTTP